MSDADYSPLARVFGRAYEQASAGKGRERHADGDDFRAQPIMMITQMVGLGFPAGQAQKKIQEACKMAAAGRAGHAKQELLGAIVYCAAAYLRLEEKEEADAAAEGSEGSLKDA